jgi:asparagine synthase (glutamine-hydrolysing)
MNDRGTKKAQAMCGLCGILQFDGGPDSDNGPLIRRMTAVLRHRGPDDEGIYCEGPIALGHRRLCVIDLSRNGRQPMSNEDGTVWITYNGEVYNFAELKEKYRLAEKGHVFRSQTDTEVLVHLYEELGIGMVGELNGMFSIAIWDTRSRELHLIRDRYGIKPLFYSRQGNRLLFASEIKSILEDPGVERRVDLQSLHDYLTLNYVPGDQSIFQGINTVPPAHRMTFTADGRMTMDRYWDLPFNVDESMNEAEAVSRVDELLDRAVSRRLVSDLPVGVLLSGGMDSSTILALMCKHHREPIHTYSVGFEDSSFNELPYARLIARQFDAVHHEVVVTPELVREMLPEYLSFIDEPYADGSAIPTYHVCRLAKEHVGVALSGEGGDEVFAGYETYAAYRVSQWFRRIPGWIRRGLIAPLVNRIPVSHKKLSLEFRMKRFLGGQDLSVDQAHLWWRIVQTEAEKRNLYSADVLEQFHAEPSGRYFHDAYEHSQAKSALDRLMYIDSTVFLPNDLMIKNDRMSMAHSLETRVPMVDHELTEFMATVPSRIKMPGLRKKHLMRAVMADRLPKSILNKKKVGLEMPYSRWLKHELLDLLRQYCDGGRIAETGLFRPEAVETLIDEHLTDRRDNGRALWGLMNFMMWHEAYIP